MRKIQRSMTAIVVICAMLCTSVFAAVIGDQVDGYDGVYLGTGMALSKGVYWTGSDYQTENFIEYTPSTDVYPVVVSGSKLCNYGNFSSMAALLEKQGKHVIGGINGDYYVVATNEPLGLVVQNGELWSSDAGHYAVGFFSDGRAIFGKPKITTSIEIGGNSFVMDSINKTRSSGGAAVYTDTYSSKTKNSGAGTDIICSVNGDVSMNCNLTLTVEEILTSGGAVNIPEGKVVISVSAAASEGLLSAIAAVQIGDTLELNVSSPSEWTGVSNAIGSLYKLVTGGQAEAGLSNDIAPRTAIGMKADGKLVLYTSDGRQSGYSTGISMASLAKRMIELGCVEATILDGGGSTSMNAIYIGDSSVSQINKPSDGYQRSVSNYIMLVTDKKATGLASRLAIYPLTTNILSGATTNFNVKAADENGYAATVPNNVSLTVSEGMGSISSDGTYTASGNGEGKITADSPGLIAATVGVKVVQTPDIIRLYYQGKSTPVTSLNVKTGTVTELMAQAMNNYVYLTSQDNCYNWSISGNIGSIDANGTFTASSNPGEGSIIVAAGEKSISIPVKVSKPGYFDDVNDGDWYYQAAQYVAEAELMSGTADRTFSPNMNMTRAMVVAVLYRMSGSPTANISSSFSDVNQGDWYYNAVCWANQNGIVEGYDGKFVPDGNVTREQLATILWRYSSSPDYVYDLSSFTDSASISEWAVPAMKWAVGSGKISGVGANTLAPSGTASRAQMATILMRMTSA